MFSLEEQRCGCKRPRSSSLDRDIDRPVVRKPREEFHPDYCPDHHPDSWVPSERFWDTLPKIRLTRRALTELERRHRQSEVQVSVPVPAGTRPEPPRHRSARLRQAALKKKNRSLILRSAQDTETDLRLRRFARQGGPDLTSIRGFPDPTMSDQISRPSKRTSTSSKRITTPSKHTTTSSKRSGPYDANYQMKLAQVGIFLTEETDKTGETVLPANYNEITTRLNAPRDSLSPSRFTEEEFQRFRKQTQNEILEAETMQKSIAVIEGNGGHISRIGGPFNNLDLFHQDITMAVPDSYDGASPMSIDHRVLRDLNRYIVPNTDMSRPAAPNFFLEGKSRRGRADVAQRQAAHTGAIGARGIISLQSYPSPALQYDGNTYSFTSTYHAGTLTMYTTHATAPKTPSDPPQYYMTQLNTFALGGNSRYFREGATYYRNARDLASEMRDSFIQQANQAAQQMSPSKHSNHSKHSTYRNRSRTTTNTASMRTSSRSRAFESLPDTDTSTDELSLDKVHKRPRNALPIDVEEEDED